MFLIFIELYRIFWKLEGTWKLISFQPYSMGREHLSLDQGTPTPIQPGLEHFYVFSFAME